MINKNLFNQISFFLGGRKEVTSLEAGAIENGGATKINKKVYSNIEKGDFININKDSNTLSVFIPSTLEADKNINSYEFVEKYYNLIENRYSEKITIEKTKGSWYSDDMKKVIIEDITIISLSKKEVTEIDINFFLNLGLQVKREMSQEAVSVSINNSLCLV